MPSNSYTKKIDLLQPTDPIPLLNNTKAENIVNTDAFDCYLVDGAFRIRHKKLSPGGSASIPTMQPDEAYYFNQTNLVIPRHMYRIDDIERGNKVGGELDAGQSSESVRIPLIIDGQVKKIKDQKKSIFGVDHLCRNTNHDIFMGGRTGGGVCGRKIGDPYVAELWEWEKQYPAGSSDNFQALVHHFLQLRFNREHPVRLVQLLLPDHNIVRIPIITSNRNGQKIHQKLKTAKPDTIFAIEHLMLLDGPDIFLGTSTFEAIT